MVKKYITIRIEHYSKILGLDLPYFIRGGFWLILSNVIGVIGGIYLSIVFARTWPKDVYGQFSFLTSMVGLIGVTTLTGMQEAVFQGSIEKLDGVFKKAIRRVFLASMLGALFLFFGFIYFFLRENPTLALSTLAASLAFPFYSLGGLVTSFYNGKRNFRQSSVVAICSNVFSIIVTSFALIKFGSLLFVALASNWSTAVINLFFSVKAVRETKNDKSDEKLLKYGYFMSFTNLIWLALDYADRFIIPLVLGFNALAVYSFAILIPLQLQNFFKVSISLGQPKIAMVKESDIKKTLIQKSLHLEVVILAIVALYIFVSPYIFKVLYPSYKESIFLSQIFALSLLYYPNNLFGSYLTRKRLIKESVFGTILFACASLGGLLLFIHLWGLIGAVISKLFSRLIQVCITQYIFFRELKRNQAVHANI